MITTRTLRPNSPLRPTAARFAHWRRVSGKSRLTDAGEPAVMAWYLSHFRLVHVGAAMVGIPLLVLAITAGFPTAATFLVTASVAGNALAGLLYPMLVRAGAKHRARAL